MTTVFVVNSEVSATKKNKRYHGESTFFKKYLR